MFDSEDYCAAKLLVISGSSFDSYEPLMDRVLEYLDFRYHQELYLEGHEELFCG